MRAGAGARQSSWPHCPSLLRGHIPEHGTVWVESLELGRSNVIGVGVAYFHHRYLLIDQRLDLVPCRLARGWIGRVDQLGSKRADLGAVPPAGIARIQEREQQRVGREGMVGDEDVPLFRLAAHLQKGRPIDDHHLNIDPGVGQLAGEDGGFVIVCLVVRRDQQADRRPRVVRLLCELLGLLRVVRTVIGDAFARVPGCAVWKDRSFGIPQVLGTEGDAQCLRLIQRGLDGAAELVIVLQDSLLRVHEEQAEDRRVGTLHLNRWIFAQGLVQITGDHFRIVVVARLYAAHARADVRHRNEPDLVEARNAGAGEAVTLFFYRLVAVEPLHLDIAVRPPLYELVGAGADIVLLLDRPVSRFGGNVFRIDRKTAINVRNEGLPGAVRRGQFQRDFILSGRLDRRSRRHQELAACTETAPSRHRGDYVLGGHLLAVVEEDTFAELDDDGPTAVFRAIAFGQHWTWRIGRVQRIQGLEVVAADDRCDVGCRQHDVERRRFSDVGFAQQGGGIGLCKQE